MQRAKAEAQSILTRQVQQIEQVCLGSYFYAPFPNKVELSGCRQND